MMPRSSSAGNQNNQLLNIHILILNAGTERISFVWQRRMYIGAVYLFDLLEHFNTIIHYLHGSAFDVTALFKLHHILVHVFGCSATAPEGKMEDGRKGMVNFPPPSYAFHSMRHKVKRTQPVLCSSCILLIEVWEQEGVGSFTCRGSLKWFL
jgi:hypothetical protein